VSKSDVGVGCHRFPDHQRECVTPPYLAHHLLVFCRPTSKFSASGSRKSMVALETRGIIYTGSGWSPTSSLRRIRVCVPRFKCPKDSTGGFKVGRFHAPE
jgi:hypothetical protein